MSEQVNLSRVQRHSHNRKQHERIVEEQALSVRQPEQKLTRIEVARLRKETKKSLRDYYMSIRKAGRRIEEGNSPSSIAIMQSDTIIPLPVKPWTAEEVEGEIPPRNLLFPSHRILWTRRFYNLLMFIFIGLTVYLLWWGLMDSPWGENRSMK